jgi:two-component system, chemotaxis family, protein-glutamate methylesterase/glutaminase
MTKPIRVVIIDDSALIREMISDILSRDPGFVVVGTARDPFEGREAIKVTNPDVITLDVEMPRMDGLTFLEKIMSLRPMPVIMVSSLTRAGADATIKALELGAIDCIAKPTGSDPRGFEIMGRELIEKLRVAATAKLGRRAAAPAAVPLAAAPAIRHPADGSRFLAIGASTGGVERIRDIMAAMPAAMPPIVITQHIGPAFVPSFAARLDKLSAMSVQVAENGARLQPGHAYIAPGDRHLTVVKDGRGFACRLDDGPPVSGHRPSVDALFQSVAASGGANAVGVILSGMGKDGAAGMKAMRDVGAFTIGESEGSCVVYGMPKAARDAGAVITELPLPKIPAEMIRAVETTGEPR